MLGQPTSGLTAAFRTAFKSNFDKVFSDVANAGFPGSAARGMSGARTSTRCNGERAERLGTAASSGSSLRAAAPAGQPRTRDSRAACPATSGTPVQYPPHASYLYEAVANANGAVISITVIAFSRNFRMRAGLPSGARACRSPYPCARQAHPFRRRNPSEANRTRRGWGLVDTRRVQPYRRDVPPAALAGAVSVHQRFRPPSFRSPPGMDARQFGNRQICLRDLEQPFRIRRRQGIGPAICGHRDPVQPRRHVAAPRVPVCTLHPHRPVSVPVDSDIPAQRVGQL